MWFKKFVFSNRFYLFPFLGFLVSGTILLSLYSKEELLLAINSHHCTFFDYIFKYYTHVGDGLFYLGLALLVFLFVSKLEAIIMAASYAFSSIPAQLIKHFLPGENFRPRSYFWSNPEKIHFVDGVEIMVSNSFPSGHTTSAISMFLVFSYFVKNKYLSVAFFLMALLVGYSRMYLGQHFFADVYGGSIIGISTTIIVIYVCDKVLNYSERENLKKGLLR